jgi:hypothetical protein
VVGVRDCDCERVGGVGAGDAGTGKKPADHRVNLRFFRSAGADNGLLDDAWRIFADGDSGARGAHQCDSARLAELERRLRVLVDEDFLDRGRIRPVLGEERLELGGEVGEAFGQRC